MAHPSGKKKKPGKPKRDKGTIPPKEKKKPKKKKL